MFPNGFRKRPAWGWMLLVLGSGCVLAATGCGSGERKLYHVSGTVTFDSRPVPAGIVLFDPDFSAGNDGTQGYAEIKDGSFDTASTGRGITGGAYLVRVRGFMPARGDVPAKMLFQEYQQTIELPTADSRQDIAVPASAVPNPDSYRILPRALSDTQVASNGFGLSC